MLWYKQAKSEANYSIIIEFGDHSQTYEFSSKDEAISAARNIKGKKISKNSWDSLGFIVTVEGFDYRDVFNDEGVFSGEDRRSLLSNRVNKNRKEHLVDRGYNVGGYGRDHYEGEKIPFKEL